MLPAIEVASPSVVIVCYNQGRYLSEAIESAARQTCGAPEILVVDDGSTDDTREVCARYPGVRYLYQENRGLPAARNTGLRHASGDYVAFLDADDLLLPNALASGVDRLSQAPGAAFTYGRYQNVFDDRSPAPTSPWQDVDHDHYLRLLESNFIGMHGTVLYRRSVLLQSGGFNESLRACEDYELYLRLARQYPLCCHDHLVAEYRQHDSNMSKDYSFMLRSVLGVLRAERARVPDRLHRKAVQSGLQVWKTYYGDLLLEEWRQLRGRERLLRLARARPRAAFRELARELLGRVRRARKFGTLNGVTPVSRTFGLDRGLPIDRHYIDQFLAENAGAIRGRVLEIGDDSYSRRFGGSRVTQQDVLHVVPGSPGATITADLADAPHILAATFDCVILTQTLQYIFDLPSAIATIWRILKPGGVVLATVPGISQICRDQEDKELDCWRFTKASVARLFGRCFDPDRVRVRSYGNVLAAISFLEGLAVRDVASQDLDYHDPDYQVTIAVAATKEGGHV